MVEYFYFLKSFAFFLKELYVHEAFNTEKLEEQAN